MTATKPDITNRGLTNACCVGPTKRCHGFIITFWSSDQNLRIRSLELKYMGLLGLPGSSTTDISFLVVLDAESPRSRCWGLYPWIADSFLISISACSLLPAWIHLRRTPVSLDEVIDMTSFNLDYHLKWPMSKYSHLRGQSSSIFTLWGRHNLVHTQDFSIHWTNVYWRLTVHRTPLQLLGI